MAMQADRTSEDTIFPWIEHALRNGDAGAALEHLAQRFRRDKQYRRLFDARLMQKRLELGLPLVSAAGYRRCAESTSAGLSGRVTFTRRAKSAN